MRPYEDIEEAKNMVYCSKCGTLNADDATVCSNCGAPLQKEAPEAAPSWRHKRYKGDYHYHYQGWGAGIGALVFGTIIILVGLSILFSQVYGISIPWWPIVLILIGIWVLFIGLRRRRHCC